MPSQKSTCSESLFVHSLVLELVQHVASHLRAERLHRRLSVEGCRLSVTENIICPDRFGLEERVIAHVQGHLVLELSDLVKKVGDDILSELIWLLLLIEPGKVFILFLQIVEVLVVSVKRS